MFNINKRFWVFILVLSFGPLFKVTGQTTYAGTLKVLNKPECRVEGYENFIVLSETLDTIQCTTLVVRGSLMNGEVIANGKRYKNNDEIIALQNKKGFFCKRLIKGRRKAPLYSGFMQRVKKDELLDEYRSVLPDEINNNPANTRMISEKTYFRWFNVPGTTEFGNNKNRKFVLNAMQSCAACAKKLKSAVANVSRIMDKYYEGKLK